MKTYQIEHEKLVGKTPTIQIYVNGDLRCVLEDKGQTDAEVFEAFFAPVSTTEVKRRIK